MRDPWVDTLPLPSTFHHSLGRTEQRSEAPHDEREVGSVIGIDQHDSPRAELVTASSASRHTPPDGSATGDLGTLSLGGDLIDDLTDIPAGQPPTDAGRGRVPIPAPAPASATESPTEPVTPPATAPAGEPTSDPTTAPATGPAQPEVRRRDVGDLVVRAGTAFEEYRQGVPGAIDTLVRLVSPLLWHTARQCGLTAAEAEDAVQQTFLQLVRSKDSISDPLAVVRWLTVSLRRLAWREKAASSRRTSEEPSDDDLPRAPSAEHSAVLSDQQRRLWAMVSELSERCRRLLAVIAFAPRPDYAAIAADLQIPVGSIGPTRGRCLAKLRARLDGGEWS